MQINLNTTPYLQGDFSSFEEALKVIDAVTPDGGGYDTSVILDKVAVSTQKVRRGEAVFERDSVAFYREEYVYPLLAALFYAAMHEGKLNVLDFGGSLGSSYFQNRKLLEGIPVEWNVVEQANFVDYGRREVPEINFHYKISDCKDKNINCVLASSSINYVDNPSEYLNELLNINAKYFIITRTYFNFDNRHRIAVEKVPETIYKAVYPIHLFDINEFVNVVGQKYRSIFYLPASDRMPFIEGNTARITPCHGWFMERIE